MTEGVKRLITNLTNYNVGIHVPVSTVEMASILYSMTFLFCNGRGRGRGNPVIARFKRHYNYKTGGTLV